MNSQRSAKVADRSVPGGLLSLGCQQGVLSPTRSEGDLLSYCPLVAVALASAPRLALPGPGAVAWASCLARAWEGTSVLAALIDAGVRWRDEGCKPHGMRLCSA